MTRRQHVAPWTGTWALVRLRLRTHRFALAGWPPTIAGLMMATAFGIRSVYDTDQARAAYRATIGESALSIALNGRGYDLATTGGIVVYEVGFYTLLILPIIAMHLMVRMTRSEEESGRDELITANRVGLLAPLGAGAIVVGTSLVTTGLLTTLGLMSAGLSAAGSLAFGVGLTLTLLWWAGVGLVTAQLSRTGRGAHTMGLAFLGALYLLRALVDGRRYPGVWANPTGWLAELHPFGDVRWWPIVASVLFGVALGALAVALRTRRDLGTGLLAERTGATSAHPWMCTPAGLAWRLGRGSLLGWSIGSILWGGLLGLMAPEMRRLLDANPEMARYLGGSTADGNNLLITMAALLAALLAASFGIQIVTRIAADEGSARLGVVLSTRMGRVRWVATELALAAAGATIISALGGLATDLALASIGQQHAAGGVVGPGIRTAFAMLPAALVIIAVSALAWAIAPRLAHVGWALLGWASLVGLLADTLRLPEWTRNLSPLHHVGRVPIEPVSPTVTTLLIGLTAVLAIITLARFRRRNLAAG